VVVRGRQSPGSADAGPVTLSQGYIAAVRRVERLVANREGADKSWVWNALQCNQAHFARAKRL
jgi:hypothetical protein